MATSQAAVVVDLNEYRQRRQARAAAESAPQTPVPAVLWCPVWVMVPLWVWAAGR